MRENHARSVVRSALIIFRTTTKQKPHIVVRRLSSTSVTIGYEESSISETGSVREGQLGNLGLGYDAAVAKGGAELSIRTEKEGATFSASSIYKGAL